MYAVKKEKSVVDSEVDAFEAELERMEQFKQEFLDGVKSDRSNPPPNSKPLLSFCSSLLPYITFRTHTTHFALARCIKHMRSALRLNSNAPDATGRSSRR